MPRIKITDSDGEVLFGTLPSGWGDTPLAPFAALATATTMPEQCTAVAQLLGLPPEPFLADASLLLPIRRAAPWLFDDSLPADDDWQPNTIQHTGRTYTHVGNLDKINAQQMEALLGFLREHDGRPLTAAPSMLAVLYCPVGVEQTADVVEATAQAFATLPMATAWPALQAFLRSSARPALNIRTAWALENELKTVLQILEAAVRTTTASTTLWQRLRRALTRAWLRSAKKTLSNS